LILPSFAVSTLSKRDVHEADAFGNGLFPGLKARLPSGAGGGATGSAASPQTSNSVSPVRPLPRWRKTARTRDVSSSAKRTPLARRPAGSGGVRFGSGIATQPLPSQYSSSIPAGGTTLSPSSSR